MKLIVDSHGTEKDVYPVQPQVDFNPSEPQPPLNWREGLEEYGTRRRYREGVESSHRGEVAIQTPCTDWYGVVFSGDWHVGAEGFAHADFDRDMNLILNTPNVGMVMMGDEADNFTWNPGAFEQIMNPHEQARLVASLFRDLIDNDKLLAHVGSNHVTEWFMKATGMEYADMVLGMVNRVPQLREGGIIHHLIGNTYLRYLARHRSRYNSSLNMQHGNRRAFERESTADVVVSAHTHDLGVAEEWLPVGGKATETHLIKSGSYKDFDRYAGQKGMAKGGIGSPVLLVNGTTGERYVTSTVPKGIKLLARLNQ